MKNLDQILYCLFSYSALSKELAFPFDESLKTHEGTATPTEIEKVNAYKMKHQDIRDAAILKLTELGVEDPMSTLLTFELMVNAL